MINGARLKLLDAVHQAENGIDYSARHGAACPYCGAKTKVYCTKPWEGSVRVRFHRCDNAGCLLRDMATSIKSVQVES